MSLSSVRIATLLLALLIAACSTTLTSAPTSAASEASSRAQLEHAARKALNTIYETTPGARALGSRSAGILVFPDVLKAGLLPGGSGGNGVYGQSGIMTGLGIQGQKITRLSKWE